MKPIIKIHLDIIPPRSTHQSGLRILKNKTGQMFIGRFNKGKSKKETNLLTELIKPFTPKEPITTPVKLSVYWNYPFLSTHKKSDRQKNFIYCDKRPDCDNLAKNIQDILTKLNFWIDDSQISILYFEKKYCNLFGIDIIIELL